MKHTKGRWEIDAAEYQVYAGEKVICDVEISDHTPDEVMANLALIAAAPDLLEALKIAMRALEDNNIDEIMSGEYEILTDAIAKAEGHQ